MAERISKATQRRRARERFRTAERMEKEYLRNLRYVTRQIDRMIKGMVGEDGTVDTTQLQNMLRQYAALIRPWAANVSRKMVSGIAKRDESEWAKLGRTVGRELRKELDDAPTGSALQEFMAEQVRLITSLPEEAAQQVHSMTLEGITTGRRAEEIAKDVLGLGAKSESRAKLIARTEVARTAAGLTMARAQHIGSTHYIWRTSADGTVRESHKAMNGKVIAWNDPPEVEKGKRYHAGMFCNCRCYPEPILPMLEK